MLADAFILQNECALCGKPCGSDKIHQKCVDYENYLVDNAT
jgi:hypothetical protein